MPRLMKPKLSIIIPVWNALRETQLTLRTLATENRMNEPRTEIIIVDNASDDMTRDWLRSVDWLPMTIIRNPQNLGFPVACNQGAKAARGDVLCFLNSDVISEGPWTATLYRATLPKNVGQAGPDVVWCPGEGFNDVGKASRWNGRKTPYVGGWCCAMRRDVFEWLGGYDEEYSPGYSEDRDLGYRVYLAGLELRKVPLPLRHLVGASAGEITFDRTAALLRGEAVFNAKWAEAEPKRIAIIRGWAIGDMVMVSGAIGGVRRKWPNSHITWVTTPAMLPWVGGCPYIDDVLIMDHNAEQEMNGQHWDLVVQLQDLRPNSQLPADEQKDNKYPDGQLDCYKVANATEKRLWWEQLDKRKIGRRTVDMCTGGWHAIETYCHTIGHGVRPWYPFAASNERSAKWATAYLQEVPNPALQTIIVNPCGGWNSKKWPREPAYNLMRRLAAPRICNVLCVGMFDNYPLPDGVVDMRRKTDGNQLIALLEQVDCVVSGDNAMAHTANALNTPVVEIWGPTHQSMYLPAGRGPVWSVQSPVACSPCSRPQCRMKLAGGSRMPCISDLDSEKVIDTIREAMAHGPNKPREWQMQLDMLDAHWKGR